MSEIRALRSLARLHNVQLSYHDGRGRRIEAAPEALCAVLRQCGCPVGSPRDAPKALREARRALEDRLCDSVAVAWDGLPPEIDLHPRENEPSVAWTLSGENVSASGSTKARELPVRGDSGSPARGRRLTLPRGLPSGYHRVVIETRRRRAEMTVISAPLRTWAGPARTQWGVFLPLYALRTERRPGLAAYPDLDVLFRWARDAGSTVVATLPFLARTPGEESPYAPSSRRFWDEIYVAPESEPGDPPRRLRRSTPKRAPLVDWPAEEERARQQLASETKRYFRNGGRSLDALDAFRRSRPEVGDYARFCAARSVLGADWRDWPARARAGRIVRGDFREEDFRGHLFAQWAADRQVSATGADARARGQTLLLDLPYGVDVRGFDVWRDPGLFAVGIASGAPPDSFSDAGQNWGTPPVIPAESRRQGHRHLAQALAHHLRHAGALRIDHMIGVHRAFWIPIGFPAREGVFVKWPAEEIYAVLSVESHRHRARIIGEDLGVVPPSVRAGMRRHGVDGLYVLPFEVDPDGVPAVGQPRRLSVASLGTHDTYPFAAIWSGRDISDRLRLGLLDSAGASRERVNRTRFRRALLAAMRNAGTIRRGSGSAKAAIAGALALLGASSASLVLVNVEDLWFETEPQNVPGARRPNWRRRARHTIEELSGMSAAGEILRALDAKRRGKEKTWPRENPRRAPGAPEGARPRRARSPRGTPPLRRRLP